MSPGAFHSYIKSVLRKASLRWPPINAVYKRARVDRGLYKCDGCGQVVPLTSVVTLKNGKTKRVKNVSVDHIQPIVPVEGFDSWDKVIERLFCAESNLQVLCKECHDKKTETEKNDRKQYR